MYFYIHPNRGDHRVIGGNLFPARIAGVNMRSAHGGGYRIDYGYHSGGEQKPFLVHHLDANAQPHLFKRAELIEAPPVQREAPKEPEPVDIGDFLADTEDNANPLAKFANDDDELEIDMFEDEFDPQTIPGITAPIAAQLEGKTLDDLKAMSESDWMKLKGVAEAKAGIIMRYLANLEE